MSGFQQQIIDLIPRLRRFAVTLAGNLADADDLLQATVEKALLRRTSYSAEFKLESWLYKIMQNHFIDLKRKEVRRGGTVLIDDRPDIVGEDGVQVQEDRSAAHKIMAVIANLPEQQRLVVACVLVDGQTYEEAAAILDIPVGTIMSRLFRARKTLQSYAEELR